MDKPWRDHRGGACPTHSQAVVRVRWRNRSVSREYKACQLVWSDRGEDFDVVAYQVVSVPEEVANG